MKELPKAYEANSIEPKILKLWEEKPYFHADPESKKPAYCICIPPPNVTGVLHMGHALVNTLQDTLIRWKRMQGFETLWVPGTDHAGIATQTVVERKLIKETGKKRVDFPREEFLSQVWKWKEENEHTILNQLKRMGCSCDWARGRFTMDERNNRSVRTMFKKLYDEGLIYRGDYLVNWDTVTETALADDEVEYEDRQSFLWTFKYPLKDGSGHINVATTRPETMLGDTAVAVSPKDERYKNWIGKTILHPITNREIPIIADNHVDPEFGTGAVKITPAHDPNDYEMGQRHNLPFITMMTPNGRINEVGGRFAGLTMQEGREKVVQALKEMGLLDKIEPHTNRVGVSYRSKAVIEPFISKQWFIKMGPFKEKMRSCVAEGRCRLIPKQWENTYFHWIDNLRDWCISRQLWWGHRIPIWYNKDQMVCYDGEGNPPLGSEWEQDPDVLDTWFSSALWPFATLGWPDKTPELEKFYPNSVLVTGHDILFFWVARMLMMGEYAMGESPFPETFLHGLIFGKSYWRKNPNGGITYVSDKERHSYDKGAPVPADVEFRWEKMSKSKGNVIDPLEIIEEYGTDALRMTMCASGTQAREIDLDLRKFEEFRNFANKVWNGARFVLMQTETLTSDDLETGLDEKLFTLEDRWILSCLNQTIETVNAALTGYHFDQAAMTAYDFFWKDFCAYYVELSKAILFGKTGDEPLRKNKQKLLLICLNLSIRLLHPMAPFITEELFQILKERFPNLQSKTADPYTNDLIKALQAEVCAVASYPQAFGKVDRQIVTLFKQLEEVVYTIRNIRGEMKLPPSAQPPIYIIGEKNDPLFKSVENHPDMITGLVKTSQLHFTQETPSLFQATGVINTLKIAIPLPADMLKQEETRLKKELERLKAQKEKISAQLENGDFVSKAPPQLIQKSRDQLTKTAIEIDEIELKLKQLIY